MKNFIEEFKCTKEEAPKKSLQRAFEILQTNPDVQACIKDKMVAAIHVNGKPEHKALSVTLDFIKTDLVTGDPLEQLGKGLCALFESLANAIKEQKEQAVKEAQND